jgi:hypothetical protein
MKTRQPAHFTAANMRIRISVLGIEVWGTQWCSKHSGRRSCTWAELFAWLWSKE